MAPPSTPSPKRTTSSMMSQFSTPESKAYNLPTTPTAPTALIDRRKIPYNTSAKIPHKTGILHLPGELRNRIYRLALVKKSSIVVVPTSDGLAAQECKKKKVDIYALRDGPPPLLRACRSIRQEANKIYFEENGFVFQDGTLSSQALYKFFDQIGDMMNSKPSKLKHLAIRRNIQIGDMKKKAEVFWRARIDEEKNAIILQRPPYDRKVFVPGMVKIKEKTVEPCRCDVRKMANPPDLRKKLSGRDLFNFAQRYCEHISQEAQDKMIDICPKCDTIRWD